MYVQKNKNSKERENIEQEDEYQNKTKERRTKIWHRSFFFYVYSRLFIQIVQRSISLFSEFDAVGHVRVCICLSNFYKLNFPFASDFHSLVGRWWKFISIQFQFGLVANRERVGREKGKVLKDIPAFALKDNSVLEVLSECPFASAREEKWFNRNPLKSLFKRFLLHFWINLNSILSH